MFARLLNKRYLFHIGFWIFILLLQVTRSNLNATSFFDIIALKKQIIEHTILLPILIGSSYFTVNYLLPSYFFSKKYFLFSIYLLLSSAFFIILMRVALYYYIIPDLYPQLAVSQLTFGKFNIFQYFFYTYSNVAIFGMIKVTRQWSIGKQKQEILIQQNLKSELDLLRSQINPHFLFNSLNNIAYLTKKDHELSYEMILKLSNMLRYMIYESSSEKVLLMNEINYLDNYINLQRIRLSNIDFIDFTVNGMAENKIIAPMLFIPFIENTFKHGIIENESERIIIRIDIFDKYLEFYTRNNINKNTLDVPDQPGIGIKNVKRRLELIYPKNYFLNIIQDKKTISVKLILPLQ